MAMNSTVTSYSPSCRSQMPASGRGARVSACAGLINQLQRCQLDSRIACLENSDSNYCRRLVEGGGGTPRPLLLTCAKKSHLGYLISFELHMGFQNFVVINKIPPLKKNDKLLARPNSITTKINIYALGM